MSPLQAPDETPLAAGSLATYSAKIEGSTPQLESDLAAGLTAANAAVQQQIDQTYADLQFATNDVHQAMAEAIAEQSQAVDAANVGIDRAVVAADTQAMDQLNKAEDGLIREGVQIPIGHAQRIKALEQVDTAIDQTIPGATSSPAPPAIQPSGYGYLNDQSGQYKVCTDYLADSPWIGLGMPLLDEHQNVIGQWYSDGSRPGYYFAVPTGQLCLEPTPPEPCPPLPFALGDPCSYTPGGFDGQIIRDAARPGHYLCSKDGRTGHVYQCPVVDNGTLIPVGATQWPASPPSNVTPAPPATSPPGSLPGVSPLPTVPSTSPPDDSTLPPTVPPSSPPFAPPPPPPSSTAPPTTSSLPSSLPSSDGFCPPPVVQCPAPVVQCAEPIVNVTVNVPPPAAPPAAPPPPKPAPPTVDLTGPPTPISAAGPGVDLTGPGATVPAAGPTVDLTGPAPPAPPPAPAKLAKDQKQIDWSDAEACQQALTLCGSIGGLPAIVSKATTTVDDAETDWLGTLVGVVNAMLNPGGTAIDTLSSFTKTKGVANGTSSAIATAYQVFGTLAVNFLGADVGPAIHNREAASYYSGKIGLVNFVSKWSGIPLDYYFTSDRYAMQFCDPQNLPSAAEATGAWLRNTITSSEWECLTKANGEIVSWAKKMRDAAVTLPNIGESVQAFYRGIITSRQALYDQLRRLGVVDEKIADQWIELAKWLPGPTDLISYMVRDVADPEVVAKFEYDDEYEKKFAGKIQDWAKKQGIDEDVFKYSWRAHWQIPSNTALYEMVHRLRPDRAALTEWEEHRQLLIAAGHGNQVPPKPPVVTVADIKYALKVNDLAPKWVDPSLAISYRPITNTDARRMYQTGLITVEQLIDRFQDNGYTLKDATDLALYEKAQKDRQLATNSGVLSVREICKAYRDGCIDFPAAKDLLADLLPNEEDRVKILNQTDTQQKFAICRTKIKAIKKRYLYGVIDYAGAVNELLLAGLGRDRAGAIADEWYYERENRLKEPRVAMLCQWYRNGYINNTEYLRRLQNLGYGEDDAFKIANICWSDEVMKRAKAAVAAAESNYKDLIALQKQTKRDMTDEIASLKLQIDTRKRELAALEPPLPAPPVRPPHTP